MRCVRKGIAQSFIIMCLVFLLIALYRSEMQAKVTGNCNNCHTMHNSQGGSPVNASGPAEFLIKYGGGTVTICWGCHGQVTSLNIITVGGTSIPQVNHNNATDLAGGNFAYITGRKSLATGTTTFTAGHNVKDTGVIDTILTSPPGDQHATGITNTNFTCAGVYGCHGDRNISGESMAIKGAHHTDDSVLRFGSINTTNQGTSIGRSYRFLNGVKGGEDADWQATKSATDHNEYYGTTSMGASSKTSPAGNTISGLCAECHGYFHGTTSSEVGSTSPWLRHPTDIALKATGEYALYTSYNFTAPVARQTIPNSPSGTVTPGTDIIMCLSCHGAHATANYKMLRWDIKNSNISTAISGCNVCHTSKN